MTTLFLIVLISGQIITVFYREKSHSLHGFLSCQRLFILSAVTWSVGWFYRAALGRFHLCQTCFGPLHMYRSDCFPAVNLWGPLGAVLIPQLFIIDAGVCNLSHRETRPECTCLCLSGLHEDWDVGAGWAWQCCSVSFGIHFWWTHTDYTYI